MKIKHVYEQLPQVLLAWYDLNKRDLPWRENRDPYRIWVSEIMLQQTRVEAVKGYFTAFINQFPSVQSLAEADDELLHKLWEGLGYYSRVRNLKKAAISIVQDHGGVFPSSYEDVIALPGIGPYTAGAICSIAYNQPTPAVDGNVLRLIARLTDDDTPIDGPKMKQKVKVALEAVYPDRAGDFTQALMELGATLCGPNGKPACDICPCCGFCMGYQRGNGEKLPVKRPKKGRRVEGKTVLVMSCDGRYALMKRPSKGLLASMWQFPELPDKLSAEDTIDKVEQMGIKTTNIPMHLERKHIFTHIEWDMSGVYLEVDTEDDRFMWFTPEEISRDVALPTAYRVFWDEIFHGE